MTQQSTIDVIGEAIEHAVLLRDVVDGLQSTQKTMPCKYFYDECGSILFDRICELPEYYPTRTELGIMRSHVEEMAELVGSEASLVEPGAGSGLKTRLLLDHLDDPVAYVPIEISGEYLQGVAEEMADRFPDVEILPVCADFTDEHDVPEPQRPAAQRAVYFPGSTLGNFTPEQRRDLLTRFAVLAGSDGGVLVGLDLQKDPEIIEAAYNDSAGVTREFNLNLLHRLNRELDADFDVSQFEHEAPYNRDLHRIEMHLVSRRAQTVRIGEHCFDFAKGERIHTESSHKFTRELIEEDASAAGLRLCDWWSDAREYFAVAWLAAG